MRRAITSILLFAFLLPAAGCGNRTTLERIGAVIVAATNAYSVELIYLRDGGSISEEKYQRLKAQADLANRRAAEFANHLRNFGAITPGNVSAITAEFAGLTQFLQTLLRDAGLAADALPVRILTFAVNTLLAASTIIAGLHPPAVVAATKNTGVARRNPTPAQVQVILPPADAQVQAALKRARK